MSALVRRSSIAVALVALLAFASAASAKTYKVTKQTDPNPGSCKADDCSLREAVIAANKHNGKDTVVLPSKSGAYKLTREPPANSDENQAKSGDLDLTDETSVKHSGKGRATVDANGIDRAFDVQPGARSSFSKLVITGGRAVGAAEPRPRTAGRGMETSPEGGGIRNSATIKVTSSVIKKNRSLTYGGGIGVVNDAGLTLIGSTVTRNTAPGRDGGGIDGDDGKIVIKRSKLTNNRSGSNGGAMYFNSELNSKIEDSTLAGNRATGDGGAIYITSGTTASRLSITGSTLSGNTSTGSGGAIKVSSGALSMVNSTIANNKASGGGGGGISSNGDANRGSGSTLTKLNAVTIVGNKAANNAPIIQLLGGGIQVLGDVPASFQVENSLIGLNFSGDIRNDCVGQIDSLGHNLIGAVEQCLGFDGPGDQLEPNPKVGKLGNNGGPTKTIPLKKGSPAIGKADKQSSPRRDQRGEKRDSKPDIGAFER